jgi:hypothetical protein
MAWTSCCNAAVRILGEAAQDDRQAWSPCTPGPVAPALICCVTSARAALARLRLCWLEDLGLADAGQVCIVCADAMAVKLADLAITCVDQSMPSAGQEQDASGYWSTLCCVTAHPRVLSSVAKSLCVQTSTAIAQLIHSTLLPPLQFRHDCANSWMQGQSHSMCRLVNKPRPAAEAYAWCCSSTYLWTLSHIVSASALTA